MGPQLQQQSGSLARAAFRYPNFRLYMGARFLSVTSSEMISVAVGWQIYALTHRPLDLGLVGLAQFAPGVLLFLFAGHTADRHSRRSILRICYAGFALCAAAFLAFTLRGIATVWPLYAVLLANGTIRAFNAPAGQAFLPQLVKPEHFANAVTWGSSFFQTATILGPMAGGLIYGFAGSPVPVYACATVAYSLAVILLSAIRIKIPSRKSAEEEPVGVILEGLRYIWRSKLILGCISLDLFAVLLGGAVALLPVYADEILHTGPYGLGVLRAAPGVGAVLMAILLAHHPLRRRAGLGMLWCVAGFGAFTIVFGISHSLTLSLIALVLTGATDMVSVIVRSTLVQLATPDEMRGRVSAVNMLFIGASNELGQFESGLTAQWFGTVPSVVLGGIGSIVVVLLWSWIFPSLHKVDRLDQSEATKDAADRA
ncbi:MAG TPA: MFS transporter [Bryobacteraceae bacterium]|nr:MFS transporter [Bryobacteraceae bacterium]